MVKTDTHSKKSGKTDFSSIIFCHTNDVITPQPLICVWCEFYQNLRLNLRSPQKPTLWEQKEREIVFVVVGAFNLRFLSKVHFLKSFSDFFQHRMSEKTKKSPSFEISELDDAQLEAKGFSKIQVSSVLLIHMGRACAETSCILKAKSGFQKVIFSLSDYLWVGVQPNGGCGMFRRIWTSGINVGSIFKGLTRGINLVEKYGLWYKI